MQIFFCASHKMSEPIPKQNLGKIVKFGIEQLFIRISTSLTPLAGLVSSFRKHFDTFFLKEEREKKVQNTKNEVEIFLFDGSFR